MPTATGISPFIGMTIPGGIVPLVVGRVIGIPVELDIVAAAPGLVYGGSAGGIMLIRFCGGRGCVGKE
jgi:hypothetical protein